MPKAASSCLLESIKPKIHLTSLSLKPQNPHATWRRCWRIHAAYTVTRLDRPCPKQSLGSMDDERAACFISWEPDVAAKTRPQGFFPFSFFLFSPFLRVAEWRPASGAPSHPPVHQQAVHIPGQTEAAWQGNWENRRRKVICNEGQHWDQKVNVGTKGSSAPRGAGSAIGCV